MSAGNETEETVNAPADLADEAADPGYSLDQVVDLLGLNRTVYVNGDSPLHAGFASEEVRAQRRAEARALRQELKQVRSIRLTKTMEKRFWEASPVLTHVYRFAMSRDADPWATLVVAMVEAIARIPPRWALCPELGRRGSVSFIAGLLGISGASKGLNTDAGIDAFKWPQTLFEPRRKQPKSGASFIKAYCKDKTTLLDEAKFYGREDIVQMLTPSKTGSAAGAANAGAGTGATGSVTSAAAAANNLMLLQDPGPAYRQLWQTAVFDFAEIKDINKGNGEIAMSLIHIFSQERLGGDSMDEKYNGVVEPCRYTAGVLIGIQPSNLKVLMDHAGTGLPQRCFLIDVSGKTGEKSFDEYVDFEGLVEDHGTIESLMLPGIPGMTVDRELQIREEIMADRPQIGVKMPEHVAREARVEMHGRRTFPEEYNPLDRHEGLIKMSVALALAYLHSFEGCGGEVGFTEEHWRWAEVLMIKHREARATVMAQAAADEDERDIRDGNRQNLRDLARKGSVASNVIKVVRSKIRESIAAGGGGRKDRPLPDGWMQISFRTINQEHRRYIPITLEEMKDSGEIKNFAIERDDSNIEVESEKRRVKMVKVQIAKKRGQSN
jgi:hypothetical protein